MDAADLVVERFWERERPADQLTALLAGGWPAFIDADQTAAVHLPRVRQLFADWEFALIEPAGDQLVAAGWGVPLRWDGTVDSLPAGYSDSLARAVSDHDAGAPADTLVICAAQVRPDLTGAGVAARLVRALAQAADAGGLARVIAPLRPTGKHRHPLMSIEEYAAWTRPDGTPHDGWLRTHLAIGGRVLATTPASQIFTAPVASWQQWSGVSMPSSGSYLVPDALAPVLVVVESGTGTLTEPGIWVQHRGGAHD